MRGPGSAPRPTPEAPATAYEIARELHGILPFGARGDALTRCPRLAEQVGGGPEDGAAAVVTAIESFTDPLLLDHHAEPVAPALVRRMLHVLLATRDLGWPGTDAPLSVRRVAAADLFFDDTQAVLSDDDWKGPAGVEFALLSALAARLCQAARDNADAAEGDQPRHAGVEMLGQLHRVQRPHRL